ncbi:MAG: biotin--[acetyl-CoA-carboxylase] ligase [Puniceicoccales bacterium]|jgi:BirA family biotin operon repressor/biotin-[acetyl-CoA-carboxylase] ligase|nr:biotin--[acetyl-CoA-carboxylase] ligase [Puniceicoccales bacterium]
MEGLESALRQNDSLKNFAFRFWPEISSTQDGARELMRQENRPAIALAGRQSAGRGRFGRKWIGQKEGNVYLSLAVGRVRPDCDRAAFAFRLARSIAERFQKKFAIPLESVPPNDLFFKERKVGGILVESAGGGEEIIVGIGLNLAPDEDLQNHCTQPVGFIDIPQPPGLGEVVLLLCLSLAEFLPDLQIPTEGGGQPSGKRVDSTPQTE